VGKDVEPPLDHLGDFMNKKAGFTSSTDADRLYGVQPPPATYAPIPTQPISALKKESRTILERRRRASISAAHVVRDETPEELIARLEREKRRGLPVNHRELYGLSDGETPRKAHTDDDDSAVPVPKPPKSERATSEESDIGILLDKRDPRFTGKIVLDAVLDRDEIELGRLKKMTFAQRMSEKARDKIRFHIVCMAALSVRYIKLRG
jgi:hypothetical protein